MLIARLLALTRAKGSRKTEGPVTGQRCVPPQGDLGESMSHTLGRVKFESGWELTVDTRPHKALDHVSGPSCIALIFGWFVFATFTS